jgi:hypothetical protein
MQNFHHSTTTIHQVIYRVKRFIKSRQN